MGNPIFTNLPAEKADDPITALALDLRWTWNHATDDLWRQLDPELWECTRNPWLILQSVSTDRLRRLLAEPRFREQVPDSLEGGPPFRRPMAPAAAGEGSPPGTYRYTAAVPADRPANYYTPRVIPQRNGVFVPLECALIAWQK
jgi:hypothetical protein